MQSEWRSGRLGNFIELKRGYDLPQAKRVKGAVPLVSSSGISDSHNASMVKGPGVVTGRYGTLGQVFYVEDDFWPLNTTLYVRDFKGNDPRYINYFLKTFDFFAFSDKAAVPGVNRNHLHEAQVSLPPVDVQRDIAATLGSLDDRIDLLHQTNATLESIVQALFKSWFIDFDPVRTKAEGREPDGMNAETAALFPDSFEDSALGEIPKGWSVSTLAEHVSAERGLSYKGAGLCLAGEGVPMHNLNSVLEGGDYKYAGIKYYSGEYKERSAVVSGDIIVANTEQGHNHRLIGFPAIIPSRYKRAIFSHHLYRVRLKPDTPLTTHTLYYMLMAPAVREQVIGCANGSTVNMLKMAGLEIPQFVCPPAQAARAFEGQAAVLRAKIESNIERAETLSALRDTLLPRLVSGKLLIPEAEAQLNEALA
ncbi:restriction endonuclease subunit S [Burkholderia stagnalis]|uniref:restriction endonuclease subunit S n=1 Tax=Burkholderia stagnalis TaxID=1503054 RepID=UPI0009BE6CF5|nr:restriction endonuclease subunit S [Burkholderia stagnalis]